MSKKVLDYNGDPVPLAGDPAEPSDWMVEWFAGRVPAPKCPHYIAVSEARAGFEKCEGCI